MAKYAAFETTYECDKCKVLLARHHFERENGSLRCPHCDCSTFYHYDKCEQTDEMDIIGPIGGVFIIRYQGVDKVKVPVVVTEEQQWMPMECPICNIQAYMIGYPSPIHFVHRVKLCDASASFGVSHMVLYGRNVIEDGSQVVLPFMEPSRIWIDGIQINPSKFRNNEVGGWEYFL